MGAVRLRGSAWILPETPETTELFQWLVQEIETFRGEATLLRVDRDREHDGRRRSRRSSIRRAAPSTRRSTQGCREVLGQLDRYRASHRGSPAALRGKLDALKRELDRIESIDYLKAPAGPRARALWETTAKRLRAAETRPSPVKSRRRRGAAPAREHVGDAAAAPHRPHRLSVADQALLRSGRQHSRSPTPPTRPARAMPVRRARRGVRSPRRGLHVRDAGQALRAQGPARASSSPRSCTRRTCTTASSRATRPTGVDLAINGRSSKPRPTTTTCSSAAWRSSTASTGPEAERRSGVDKRARIDAMDTVECVATRGCSERCSAAFGVYGLAPRTPARAAQERRSRCRRTLRS